MKGLISFYAILCLVVLPGCSTIGGVWEAGTEIVAGTADAVLKGTATVARSVTDDVINVAQVTADIATGTIDTVAAEVDAQTDVIQEPEKSEGK